MGAVATLAGSGPFLLALTLLLPLINLGLLAFPGLRKYAARMSPWTALPALTAAAVAPDGATLSLPWLLTGIELYLDSVGRPFLLLAGILWPAAAGLARQRMAAREHRRFLGFGLATLSGNLGVCLAPGAVGFYLFYGIMSLAIYGLIFGDGGIRHRRAANVYIVLTMAAEGALLAALFLHAHAEPITGPFAAFLAIFALGLKLGLVPLHVWMPLAYAAAPAASGAMLGGSMVNAGLIGWLRFLPLGQQALPGAGGTLVVLGLAAAFGGVALGLFQRQARAVLGYSSLSQMGWVTVGVGAGLLAPSQWGPALQGAVIAYALHHGLVKGGLFLATETASGKDRQRLATVLAWIPLAGLALMLAGAPGTSGAAAKTALKKALAHLPGAPSAIVAGVLAAGAVATAGLLLRFLALARSSPASGPEGEHYAPIWTFLPLVAAGILPWAWPVMRPAVIASLGPYFLASTAPIVLALILAAVAVRLGPQDRLSLPAGDALWLIFPPLRWLGRKLRLMARGLEQAWTNFIEVLQPPIFLLRTIVNRQPVPADRWGWTASGAALLVLLAALAWIL